ncbi:hypothetical protein AALO_G00306610 [Alosa alosa]|uniref:Uncharacterized protein n=1 Tax=Alosa alosa TaxID=278164 RepID=A0AAV6FCP6_9TELE|nr:hypothetical protein AALO_G00306610 [Alosa alosa]
MGKYLSHSLTISNQSFSIMLVMWMRWCGQTKTEERMQHSFLFFTVTVYRKFVCCFVSRPLYVQLYVGWDVHCVHCFCGGK